MNQILICILIMIVIIQEYGIINGGNTVSLFINQNSYGYNNLLKLQDVF